MSDSVRPHRRQPTRLPHPWDSPGKNAGVGCHFLLQCMKVKSEREVSQSCPTLSDPMDRSPPGSSAHGIFQARVLEWGAIAFSGFWPNADLNAASPPSCSWTHPYGCLLELPAGPGNSAVSQGTAQVGQGAETLPLVPGSSTQGQLREAPRGKVCVAFKPGSWCPRQRLCVLSVSGARHRKESLVSAPACPRIFCFLRV